MIVAVKNCRYIVDTRQLKKYCFFATFSVYCSNISIVHKGKPRVKKILASEWGKLFMEYGE